MKARALTLLLVSIPAAGCSLHGAKETSSTTTSSTTPAPVTTTVGRMALTVYRVDRGMLRPTVVHVVATQAVASAALHELGIVGSVAIANGTATVTTNADLSDDQVAEIVWTLTQFSSVQRVDVAGRTGLTRDDFASLVPAIAVEAPAPGASVSSPFHVSGTASVYEATLVVQVVRDGKVVAKQNIMASEGAPGRGTFDTAVSAPAGDATVQVFSPSAVDGSPQHEVDVDVTVTP